MKERAYDRAAATAYARRWALSRHPAYYDFERVGGDCTSFASQCILAGAGKMNYTPVIGWYYRSAKDRTASWSGVEYLRRFLTGNRGLGPYAVEAPLSQAEPGDIVQLGRKGGKFYHSPVVLAVRGDEIYIAAHSSDVLDKPLSGYQYDQARLLHIVGVRV